MAPLGRIRREHDLILSENNNPSSLFTYIIEDCEIPLSYVITSLLKQNPEKSVKFTFTYPSNYPFAPPEVQFQGIDEFVFTLRIYDYLSLKHFFPCLSAESWLPTNKCIDILKEISLYFVADPIHPLGFGSVVGRAEVEEQQELSTSDEAIIHTARTEAIHSATFADHPIYAEYEQIIATKIFCFPANDISKVLKLRAVLVVEKLLPAFLSLQEILVIWIPLQVITLYTFDLVVEGAHRPRFPYTFISHKHSSTPDKLGKDVMASLSLLGAELIWMDLCSMFQPDTTIKGCNYNRHTRPVVDQLNKIMLFSSKGAILLDSQAVHSDPLEIRSAFLDIYHKFHDLEGAINDFLPLAAPATQSPSRDPVIKVATTDPTIHGIADTLLQLLHILEEEWFPVNEYFGRLWCYVERLGMDPSSLFVYYKSPLVRDQTITTLQLHVTAHVQSLQQLTFRLSPFVFSYLYRITYPEAIYKSGPPEMIAYEKYLTCWKRLLVAVTKYCNRVQPLFGFASSFPCYPVLGPFAQVTLLQCYCDADRVVVADIEMKLRFQKISYLPDWTAALQIALGKPNAPIGLTRSVLSNQFHTQPKLLEFSLVFAWIQQLIALSEEGTVGSNNFDSISVQVKDVVHHYTWEKDQKCWIVSFPVYSTTLPSVGYSSRCAREYCLCQLIQNIDFQSNMYRNGIDPGRRFPLKLKGGVDFV